MVFVSILLHAEFGWNDNRKSPEIPGSLRKYHFSSAEIMSQNENLNNDENSTFHKIQKQNLILLPETHTIYYKELHTVMGLE